MLCKG
jgi:Tetratricopeptide repeat